MERKTIIITYTANNLSERFELLGKLVAFDFNLESHLKISKVIIGNIPEHFDLEGIKTIPGVKSVEYNRTIKKLN